MCDKLVHKGPDFLKCFLNHLRMQELYNRVMTRNPYMIRFAADQFKTKKMCNEAFGKNPWHSLEYIPDCFTTQEMWTKAVEKYPSNLRYVLDHFKTQQMCEKAVVCNPFALDYIPDRFKTYKMCIKAVEEDPWSLESIPDHLCSMFLIGL